MKIMDLIQIILKYFYLFPDILMAPLLLPLLVKLMKEKGGYTDKPEKYLEEYMEKNNLTTYEEAYEFIFKEETHLCLHGIIPSFNESTYILTNSSLVLFILITIPPILNSHHFMNYFV